MVEAAGFGDFVEAYSRTLLREAWLLTGNWALAEDLVQSALAATWPRWETLTRADAPQLYVRKVMLTTFLRWQRRRWNREVATADPTVIDGADAFEHVDLRVSLTDAMSNLPTRQRAVVVLRYFADMSEVQTAQVLGCSVGAVKSNASRALSRMRMAPGLAEVLTSGGDGQ